MKLLRYIRCLLVDHHHWHVNNPNEIYYWPCGQIRAHIIEEKCCYCGRIRINAHWF